MSDRFGGVQIVSKQQVDGGHETVEIELVWVMCVWCVWCVWCVCVREGEEGREKEREGDVGRWWGQRAGDNKDRITSCPQIPISTWRWIGTLGTSQLRTHLLDTWIISSIFHPNQKLGLPQLLDYYLL